MTMNFLSYKWWTKRRRSWVAHVLITLGVATLFAFFFVGPADFSWVIGLTLSTAFYMHREWFKDRAKYIAAGTWTEAKKEDGVADAGGAFCLWLGAVVTLILSRCGG